MATSIFLYALFAGFASMFIGCIIVCVAGMIDVAFNYKKRIEQKVDIGLRSSLLVWLSVGITAIFVFLGMFGIISPDFL